MRYVNICPYTPYTGLAAARFRLLAFACGVFVLAGCVGQVAKTPPPPPPSPAQNARFGHVFIVVEENHNYSEFVANSSAPYVNSLVNQYGLASNYFANAHPSILDYFMLTTGQTLTLIDALIPDIFHVSDDSVVQELSAAGKTWKSYAEDLPDIGYTGGDSGKYAVRHNPLAYMTDVQNDSAQKQNLVPFTHFPIDFSTANLPAYSFIVPNFCDDGHDCPLSTADNWLKTNLDPSFRAPCSRKTVFSSSCLMKPISPISLPAEATSLPSS
jgi:phosphatidylinositol-3-phosphatase